jgi:hypothetical protein
MMKSESRRCILESVCEGFIKVTLDFEKGEGL